MKFIFLLTFFSAINVSASVYSQSTKFNLSVKDKTLKEAFKIIEDNSDFRFFYSDNFHDLNNIVALDAKDENIDIVMSSLLAKSTISYKVLDNNIIVITPVQGESSVQSPVTGKVTNPSGEPLVGVTVSVKGTNLGTLTSGDGKFSIPEVPNNATIIFSFIGMATQEIIYTGQSGINVVMVEEAVGLDEVVVVGYGTQSKAMVSTAISSIGAAKLSGIPVTDPAQAMVGQIAGVRFQQATGEPGSAPYIRIRGSGSITSSNSPLYVIDGYPTDDANFFNSILPSDIESIDVLKDAASAAIYGSRAGNGVILVTTKSGKLGRTKFTFDLNSGVQQVISRYEMADAETFVQVAKESRINQGMAIPDFLNQPENWVYTDWQDAIFRTAPYQNAQFGASGGNEKMNFSLSLGYLDNEGVIKKSFEKRYSLRASFNAAISPKLKIGVNFAPTYSITRSQSTSGGNTSTGVDGILADAVSNIPILPVMKDNGDYFVIVQDAEMKTIFNDQLSNPLNKIDANLNYTYAIRQTANTFLSFEPIKGLILKSTLNLGISNSRNEVYREAFLARGNGNTGNISTPNLAQITASRDNITGTNWYWSNTATYDFKIGDNHKFTALVGYDVSKQDNYSVKVTPRTDVDNPVAFINTSIKNISGAILTTGASSKNEYVMDAYFGRINYSFAGKYILSGSLRRDRSSRFGPGNRAGLFPSLSAAWNASDEPFMKNVTFLSTAKARLSYGETGNDRLSGSYPWLSTLTKSYYNFGTTDARVLTYAPGGFSNANLGWEKNKQSDAGIDLGFLKDRILLNVDVYVRNSNLILSADIPTLNGKATTSMQNIGNVRNKGLELTIESRNLINTIKWQTNFNISFNKNEITSLNGDAKFYGNATSYIRNYVGRPFADIYAYKIIGVFNSAQDLIDYPQFGTQGIGDLRYEDVSGAAGIPDGKIDANDMKLIGNAQPKFVYGLTNTFQYKGFDLNILLDGSYGGYVVNQFERAISLLRHLENSIARISENRWISEEEPGDGFTPRAGSKYLSTNITTNSRYVFKTDFLRIRNISFGYNVPQSFTQKIKIQSMRVFISVANLYTFTKYPGWNPEGNTNGDNAISNGYDIGSYPVSRNSSIGISLGF